MPDTRQIYGDAAVSDFIEMLKTPISPADPNAKERVQYNLRLAHQMLASTIVALADVDPEAYGHLLAAMRELSGALKIKPAGGAM